MFCQDKTDPFNVYETYIPLSFYTVEPIASTPISLKKVIGMDDVAVDGDSIIINDLENELGYGEIYVYDLDIKADDGECVLILGKDVFNATDPNFEILSFEILQTEKNTYDKLLVSTKDMQLYAINYRKLFGADAETPNE